MNLILFQEQEISAPLLHQDPRAIHICRVLGCGEGDSFDAGIINGHRGKGIIRSITPECIAWEFQSVSQPAPLHPVTLVVGLPRPQSARRILKDITSMGVRNILFALTEKGENSYAASRLWRNGEYRQYLIQGAEMAFTTRIPEVGLPKGLKAVLDNLGIDSVKERGNHSQEIRVALDNYEAEVRLGELLTKSLLPSNAVVAVGSERGWSKKERRNLKDNGFVLTSIGERVLRTETASIAAVALILNTMGLM